MAGASVPGPVGIGVNQPVVDAGTSALIATPLPGPTGVPSATPTAPEAVANDAEIEALDLSAVARLAAYALKKAHPSIKFTSGRRRKADQARAMSGNVAKNRKWIEETYKDSPLRKRLQDWVDANADKKTAAEIEVGLSAIFDAASDEEVGKFSKHLSGMAFDVQPVKDNADEIKKTIRGLAGLDIFLDTEGGLERWHAQF